MSITPTAPGERLVVPFPNRCGFASVVVTLPESVGQLNLTVRRLWALPQTVPLPQTSTAPALIFEADLSDLNGTRVQPESAVLQVRVSDEWFESCPAARCRPQLLHYHGGAWTRHDLELVDRFNGTRVLQATTSGFSVFAVAGIDATPGADSSVLVWGWLLAPVVGAVAVRTAVAHRRRAVAAVELGRGEAEAAPGPDGTPPADEKVSRLLREMKDKEELLQFVNNAAHDLANPLTPIRIQLDLLAMAADGSINAAQQKSLEILGRSVDQIGRLVEDLRDAARLQAGKLRFSMGPVDLAKLARHSVETYQAQAGSFKVDLGVDAAEPLPVEGDADRVTQVLTNFLTNALKFTPEGGRVHVHAVREGSEAMVLVRDSGLGLSAQDQARLFRPFSQGHGEAQKKKGTGLGLYIAKAIIEAHGGRLGCASDGPGTGSTFWFALPMRAEVADPPAPNPEQPWPPARSAS